MAQILALVIGVGSVGLYMSAFFFPEIYRRYDLVWSGVGLFYALILWVCAGQVRGALLVSHIAAVALVGWFLWQNLELRRQLVPPEQQTPQGAAGRSQMPPEKTSLSAEVGERLGELLNWLSRRAATLQAQLSAGDNEE